MDPRHECTSIKSSLHAGGYPLSPLLEHSTSSELAQLANVSHWLLHSADAEDLRSVHPFGHVFGSSLGHAAAAQWLHIARHCASAVPSSSSLPHPPRQAQTALNTAHFSNESVLCNLTGRL